MEDLPEHVMGDILSRLPVKSIIHCKCVCKKWLDLVSDSYFANLHLSRSHASILIYHKRRILKLVEVKNELDHHHLHHDPLSSLDINLAPPFQESSILLVGSVNGLLCLWMFGPRKDNTYICNPITREYIMLPSKQYCLPNLMTTVYCFGVGSMTEEYKVIRICKRNFASNSTPTSRFEAEVYTLGTCQWRNLGHVSYHLKAFYGTFLNSHAHWVINDPENLYAFNFDKETFKLFPSPPVETIQGNQIRSRTLGVLRGCLCQCNTFDSEFRIWVMKEYGIKKSWLVELVIMKQSITPGPDWWMRKSMQLIERLNDETILIFLFHDKVLAYCPKSRTILDTGIFDHFNTGVAYRPSFLKLHNIKSERVHVMM